MKKITVIGAGFSGLSAACYLAAAGYEVDIYEKNECIGGRARQFKTANGFVFDMGPSWYWMPDVFEGFFNDFSATTADFYDLKKLNPAFDVVYQKDEILHIPERYDELASMFENLERGSGKKLLKFMEAAKEKYDIAMQQFVSKPGISLLEFADIDIMRSAVKLELFTSLRKLVRKYFKHPQLVALMEFPVLFLGAMPHNIPAMYSFMNYAGLVMGTFYPMGGFGKVIEAMANIAEKQGAVIHTGQPVEKIVIEKGIANGLMVQGKWKAYDAIVASADYAYVEKELIDNAYRNYDDAYWESRTFAPSCLLFYLGINKKIQHLEHHTLFFDEDLDKHSEEIYKNPSWPVRPLFYVCCPSKTDNTVAPEGKENLFLLMPIAVGLNDDETIREKYFHLMMERLEKHTKTEIRKHVIYKKSYCVEDFINDYHAYKGNAYGLANTLKQTAVLKPKIYNSKIKNLFYTGQLTVPGPGVPPSIISGKIAAGLVQNYFKN